MRTIKRNTLKLNVLKLNSLRKLCHAYTKEKQYWLNRLREWRYQRLLGNARAVRDEFVGMKYKSIHGLQARHWKLALQDAVETWDKYWQSIFVAVRPKIHQKYSNEAERHYAYWLLKSYSQLADVMKGKSPNPSFAIEESIRHKISRYIQRVIKQHKGRPPSVKKGRTVKFDANCYEMIENHGRQYLKIMSLEKGKRIIVPLEGHTPIDGNIIVVVDKEVVVHATQDVHSMPNTGDFHEAIDFGYTEVMTSTDGHAYGTELGGILTRSSDGRNRKMQKRHKLHSLEKRLRHSNPAKAKQIRKFNLGRHQLEERERKIKKTLEREINTAINELVKEKKPKVLITENLGSNFGFNKGKILNRRLSSWVRGVIQDRIAFKALVKGFHHEQVNPAYGSQGCPCCEFVDYKNRNGDHFKCLFCGHEDKADRIAALNYRRRYGDEEIGLYMPYDQVRTILLTRFHRRLETGQPVTVPGRTLETATQVHPPPCRDNQSQPEGRKTSINRAVNQRAKQYKYV